MTALRQGFLLNDLLFTNHDLLFQEVIRYSQQDRDLTFAVHVVPRASQSEIAGEHDGTLRVRVAAPPVEGAANRELIRVLAKSLKLPRTAFQIVSGINSRRKIVRIHGADAAKLEQLVFSK